MPFDCWTETAAAAPPISPEAVYRARREAAAAAVVEALGPDGRLDLSVFMVSHLEPRFRWLGPFSPVRAVRRGCFIGWLAHLGHGGWHRDGGWAPRLAGHDGNAFCAAYNHFGIPHDEHGQCLFLPKGACGPRPTAAAFAAAFLALPYAAEEERA